jgi:hypothetical protein
MTGLQFTGITPTAPSGIGGLLRDHFSNGRLFATIGWHGGLVNVSYWGEQHLGAAAIFEAGLETAWYKLFRACVNVGSGRRYPVWTDARIFPFGVSAHANIESVDLAQDILLLPDAIVQRFNVISNPQQHPLAVEMFHMEQVCRVSRENREWSDLAYNAELNAMVARCVDTNPVAADTREQGLAQSGAADLPPDSPYAETWVGIGCSTPMKCRKSFNDFKIYMSSDQAADLSVSFFVVFASSEQRLTSRLNELTASVNDECDTLLAGYNSRLLSRPQINVGSEALNSAFGQYPEVINFMKIPDRPGAVRATQAGYFVWGWDGMTPLMPCPLANEPEFAGEVLEFFQDTWDANVGIPHAFTTAFQPRMKAPFPAQCQYIAGLYHYVSVSGDLELARRVFPTCKAILDRCRAREVKGTGLVGGSALWPDFPEAMEENGLDVSSLNNSLLYQGLRSIEYLASALSESSLAAECREWAAILRKSFVKYLYDEEQGFFITSCSSDDLSPRKHYGCQTVFWVTPFARELVSHAPGRIAAFMENHLRSAKCLLSLPQWDTAWMADGNQLGSSFPTADYFYLNVHKLLGNDVALKNWLGDVEWFWRYHTAPEAFTPEADNEDQFGPDNHGCKQLQAISAWYYSVYNGLAGLDFDHEGITITPWGSAPVEIQGLRLRDCTINLKISGAGNHIASMTLNGTNLPSSSRKLLWKDIAGSTARLEIVRTEQPEDHPVIVRMDGLRLSRLAVAARSLSARVEGDMTGEVVIQTSERSNVTIGGKPADCDLEPSTRTISVHFSNCGPMDLDIIE